MAQEKVLLVDDDPDYVEALAARLEHRGMQVHTATNGEEALRQEGLGTYDAIVLDLFMPGMDGVETMKRMLQRNPNLQVILLTGHASLQTGIEAMKQGAMDYIEKPADFETLAEKIKQAQARHLLLVEKHNEEKMKDILRDRSW